MGEVRDISVKLTDTESEMAVMIGGKRQLASILDGRRDSYGFTGDGWGIHIQGAAGELAFCKAINAHWPGSLNTFKAPDVGSNIQVRTRVAKPQERKELIVRPKDSDSEVFVLVVGQIPEFRVSGWIRGSDAKLNDSWLLGVGGRPKAYFVPDLYLKGFPIG